MASSDSELLGRNHTYNVTSMSVDSPTCFERFKNRVDSFREYLATTCCACISSVPSFALVVLAVVLVMLLIASVPLAFAFTYMNAGTDTSDASSGHVRLLRDHNSWYGDAEGFSNSTLIQSSLALPPKIASCKGFGFACTNEPSIVIGTYKRCDGFKDCPDGSDELDCDRCQTTLSCMQNGQPDRKICLRGDKLCDGIEHCADGADEKAYCRETCPDDMLKCKDANICLPQHLICDGDKHCPGGDDEVNCSSCKNGAKFCKRTMTCIPKWQLCDGNMDCPDNSDEHDCDCKMCSGNGRALCNGDLKMCIEKNKICDGKAECPGGEDEESCPGTCALDAQMKNDDSTPDANKFKDIQCGSKTYSWQYACGALIPGCNGQCEECNLGTAFDCKLKSDSSKFTKCIHRSNVCDGLDDCGNNADEVNCDCNEPGMHLCSAVNFNGQQKCYSDAQKCDGYNDCPDGEDETKCKECSNGGFLCEKEEKCIPGIKRCDGIKDCKDGMDEDNCSCKECMAHPYRMYMCSDGARCYRFDDVCNPYSQCPNADDRDKLHCALSQGGGMSYL